MIGLLLLLVLVSLLGIVGTIRALVNGDVRPLPDVPDYDSRRPLP